MVIHLGKKMKSEAYLTPNTNMNLKMDRQSKHNQALEGIRGGMITYASQLASLPSVHG